MIISLSLIGMQQDAQAQVSQNFTLGEGSDELRMAAFDRSVTDGDNSDLIAIVPNQVRTNTVDPINQRMILSSGPALLTQSILIDMNATLGDLQETINSDSTNIFTYDVIGFTSTPRNHNIYLFIADDDVIFSGTESSASIGPIVPLVSNGDNQGSVTITDTTTAMFDSTLANKNIGLYIEYNGLIPLSSNPSNRHSIEADFSLSPIPPGLTSQQQVEYEKLVAVIAVRNLALEQANIILDYWSDPTNRLADDRVLAQEWIDHANFHISLTTIQRDFHQTELDQLTG